MKQSAVEWLEEKLSFDNGFGVRYPIHIKMENLNSYFKQAKEMQEQQQGYSKEEVFDFSEWVSLNDWVYLPIKGYWVNEEQQKFTTKQLFEQFKTNFKREKVIINDLYISVKLLNRLRNKVTYSNNKQVPVITYLDEISNYTRMEFYEIYGLMAKQKIELQEIMLKFNVKFKTN